MIYAGLFLITFSMLALEVSLVRLLSVTTWYHLSFFAISTAMLGMTAGATRVYLRPHSFTGEQLQRSLCSAAALLAGGIPLSLILLCLVPLGVYESVMSLFALCLTTAACALPFFFAGVVTSAVITRYDRPIGLLYASDLLGASTGCLFALGGMQLLDAPSFILLCAGTCALGGFCFAHSARLARSRRLFAAMFVAAAAAVALNALSPAGIRPVIMKGVSIEPANRFLRERWNSFSRVAVYPKKREAPQYWGPSPLAPKDSIEQYRMNIDGGAGTTLRHFSSLRDIEHLRFDVTNVGYFLGRPGKVCIIGVGGGRDVQSALVFGYGDVTGIEINPIFCDWLEGEFRGFAGLAGRPGIALVRAEARSHLTRDPQRYAFVQMSLIDTWAATAAGAFTLSENSLYTIEAWRIFLRTLTEDGIFSVSRWHNPEKLGETGRVLSLAVATLLREGVHDPAAHIALISSYNISTLLVCRRPFTPGDIALLRDVCAQYRYRIVALPGQSPADPLLAELLSARSMDRLLGAAERASLNYAPPTDEAPYFFNMLRLKSILAGAGGASGVVRGNLVATSTLAGLLLSLLILTGATIVIPLALRARRVAATAPPVRTLRQGALYFSLIGAAFMLTEIALMQRLTILLTHPVYALSILLFSIIASAGIGSLCSERLPVSRRPWIYLFPAATVCLLIGVRFLLNAAIPRFAAEDLPIKILVSVGMIFPLGFCMGLFFPTGMRLAKRASPADTPWYWALNGIFGVLFSVVAVFISIFVSISTNFFVASALYAAAIAPLHGLYRQGAEPPAGTHASAG